ncbi:MAG: CHAT domain-containing protein [Nitrospira sp.]|nr:CHAT domain-containing protein [Nitrospira sp.]
MTPPSSHKRPLLRLTITVVISSLFVVSCTAVLYTRATRLQDEGHYDEAISVMQKVLAKEEQKGPEHVGTAKALTRLAQLYYLTGAYAQAEPLYQRAVAIVEKVQGPDHPTTATVLNDLGMLYQEMGAYDRAKPLYQRALVIREQQQGFEHRDTAISVNSLGQLYQATGAYAQAEPLFQRAVAIVEKVQGGEHPDTAIMLNNLATFYVAKGAYAQAEPLYQRALAIWEKGLGQEHPHTASGIANLAYLYHLMGAYAKAEPFSKRALTIREKVLGPEHPDTALEVNNLATLYHRTGAYGKAEPLYQRALATNEKVLGPNHPNTALTIGNLAELYLARGAYAQAEPLYQRALAIYEKVHGSEHPDTARALNNLALQYYTIGAFAKAEPLMDRVLAINEKTLGPDHPNTALTINNLAELYRAMGLYAKAEPLYQRALAIWEKTLGPEHPNTAGALNNLALLYWAAADLTKTLSFASRAQAIQEKHLSTFFLTGSESRKQAYVVLMGSGTSANISLSLTLPDRQAKALGLQSVLATKGRVLEAMSDNTARLRESVKPEDRAIVEGLITVAQQRSTLIYQGINNFKSEVYRRQLQELVARQEQLEADLSARSVEFRHEVASITFAAVQATIPKGAALVEWYRYDPFNPKAKDQSSQWGKPRYVAYVLKRDGDPTVVDVGEAESIEQLVHDFQSGLSNPTSTYVKDAAKELYQKLLKPLQPHLANVQQLLLAPDNALNLVPFAALMDESGTYLGSKKSITYITSGRDLLRIGTTAVSNSDMVVVANPDYGPSSQQPNQADSAVQPTRSLDLDREGMTFRPLPGTAEEAKILTTLLRISEDHVLTQAKATEDRFKQLHGPRILHVATHGFFLKDNELPAAVLKQVGFSQDRAPVPLGENPLLRSGLALAGANQRRSGDSDDGILTAAEVAQMDLRGTQLVVLSACETGVGDVQNGEGVYGLRRALVLAGAETQVTSLWKVADDATKDLMVDYYQRLLKGEGRSEALRNAQLTMMKSKDRSHPYYWAAFVPIGDWRPLATTK